MKRAAAVVAVLAVMAAWWWWRRGARPGAAPRGPVLLVYHALTAGFTAVDGLPARADKRAVECSLGRWPVRVAVAGTALIALDTEVKAIAVVDLPALARGRCQIARTPLGAAQVPYRGRLIGDDLYVVYFAGNLVEDYRWPELTLRRTLRFATPENLGLADVALVDGRLAVAATGYRCFERVCPGGRFGPARLFFPEERWPFPSLQTANVNASRLYHHPSPPSWWLLESGDLEGGWSSVQRLDGGTPGAPFVLGAPLQLPRGSGIASAFAVGRAFVLTQMLGEHLFIVDAASGRLVRIARFDGAALVDVPLDLGEVPERADAAFQDLVVEPGAPSRFYLVDRRGERLVHVEVDAALALRVLDVVPLRGAAFQSAPDWAVWMVQSSSR